MRGLMLLFLLGLNYHSYAFTWADLWLTKDQQAQLLVNKGQFKEAESQFKQQDWRATAAYRSGNYQSAAQQYHALGNDLGYYNEGNALAQLNQFKQAIKAYDKAIALNPNNKDALYNRKLLEDLLKKQNQQNENQQSNDQQKQNQQGEKQQNNDQKKQNQQGEKQQNNDQQKQNQQGEKQQNNDQQKQNQQGKNQQNNAQQKQNQQGDNQQNNDQQNQQGEKQQNSDQQKQNQQGENQQKQDQHKQNQQDNNTNEQVRPEQADKANDTQGMKEEQSAAEHEKQQAKNQWLRLIPDDPGGLMREKFLRDHLRREGEWYQ